MPETNYNHSFSDLLGSHKSVFLDDEENKGEKVFTSSYVPASLWHRETEMKTLVSYFKSIITNPTNSSRKVVLYGSVGTGKTVISNAFGKELSDYLKRIRNVGDPTFRYFHINCRKTKTPHLILTTIIRHLVSGFPIRGFGVDELLRMFTLLLYEQNLVVFLVLDEIDYLLPEERTDFLYALSRLEESPIVREEYGFLDNKVESRLNLLTITRDKNFRYYLDTSTASSLGQNFITFKPYTRYQLFDILSVRAKLGLQEGSYSDEILDTISGLAEENGDARFAIELLWRTAKIVDQEGQDKLTGEHIRKAVIAVMPIEKSIIEDLNTHQKLVLLSITRLLSNNKQPYVTTPEVKNEYERVCEEAGTHPRRQTQVWAYLKDLSRLGVIQQEVENRHHDGRSLGRIATIRIRDIPTDEILNSLNYLLCTS
ncbi:MAG: AAA family ATPase [Candidatus Heimdallarchaeota archaeon]|nr:AAA family ATPase [Candidatus Heimdallarchaeota archaeon]